MYFGVYECFKERSLFMVREGVFRGGGVYLSAQDWGSGEV